MHAWDRDTGMLDRQLCAQRAATFGVYTYRAWRNHHGGMHADVHGLFAAISMPADCALACHAGLCWHQPPPLLCE